MNWLHFALFFLFFKLAIALKECKKSQIIFSSTPCTPEGSHFILKLPKDPDVCVVSDGPKFVRNCTKTCLPGHALDEMSNKCLSCPTGTAAPGNVFEVNQWSILPNGFYSDVLSNNGQSDCTNFHWKPQGTYLLGQSNGVCTSELALQNNNIKEGNVTFQYKLIDSLSMAYFTIRSERCVLDAGKSHFLPPSAKNSWSTFSAPVPAGVSLMQWYLFSENWYDNNAAVSQLMLKSVRVTNRPSTINCLECEPGYYADEEGSDICKKCPEGKFSTQRASNCETCPNGTFSLPGSSECIKKELCKTSEYTISYSSCSDESNSQTLIKRPIEPIFCDYVTLSEPIGSPVACQPCPLGTKVRNATHCTMCPSGFLSTADGHDCHSCPADEVPIFGIKYETWSRMPPRMTTYCLDDDIACQPWQMNGSAIFVGPGLKNHAYSILELNLLEGFLGPKLREPNPYFQTIAPFPGTKVVFEFELDCQGQCSLAFIKTTEFDSYLINKWIGPVDRTSYEFTVDDCEGAVFSWEFQRWNTPETEYNPNTRNEKAIIYSIAANNTLGTGALGCKKCPLGIDSSFCKPCGEGLFYTMVKNETINETHAECVPCPTGTTVISDASAVMTVEQACRHCPPGTVPGGDEECLIDLHPNLSSSQSYELERLLSTEFTTEGLKLFTSQGNEFQQHFRLFLNTREYGFRSNCVSDQEIDANVTSWICRETWTPVKDSSAVGLKYHTRALSLGDKLVKAMPTNFSAEFTKDINTRLINGGWKADYVGTDYHLFYQTKATTRACQDGINTIVTLRCGVIADESNGPAKIEIPPNCGVGTCDGCQFHFMVISPLACAVCRAEDFNRIESGCHSGSMEVTLIPPKTCRPPANFKAVIVESCPLLSRQGLVAVCLTMALVALLLLALFYCYRRNKKLEYKYMKLVEGAEARVKMSYKGSNLQVDHQDTGCGLPEDSKETEIYHRNNISAFAGDERDGRWNQFASSTSNENNDAGLGPVIFRSGTADDSHILVLSDGNEPI